MMRLAVLASTVQGTLSAACADEVHSHSSCVGESIYEAKTVSDSDECCAFCASDAKCKQWTLSWKKCMLTAYDAEVTSGLLRFFETCGIKAAPPTPAPPTPKPAPGVKNTWAVIAAGSSGYTNYRHQADACHAYHVLISAGVPADQIIVMMQDDVAQSWWNPFKGKLYNRPGTNSPDVYAGCKIDYRGKIVTAKLFTSVITGDTTGLPAGSKVLKSTSKNRVFLNFVDHGGVGIVGFPNGPPLHASTLSAALKTMQSKQMFSELLFYMEACESGSMFPDLTADGKILAVTAANGQESSWGNYCGNDAVVNGKNLETCLGDLFQNSWTEDSDKGQGATETIRTQVDRVTKLTTRSHVCQFGDKSFMNEPFGNFELFRTSSAAIPAISGHPVDVRDIPLYTAQFLYEHAKTAEEKKERNETLQEVLDSRQADDYSFWAMSRTMCSRTNMLGCDHMLRSARHTMADTDCHMQLVNTVHEKCPPRSERNLGGWNYYNMKYSQMMVNACENLDFLGQSAAELQTIIVQGCTSASQKVRSSIEVVV